MNKTLPKLFPEHLRFKFNYLNSKNALNNIQYAFQHHSFELLRAKGWTPAILLELIDFESSLLVFLGSWKVPASANST